MRNAFRTIDLADECIRGAGDNLLAIQRRSPTFDHCKRGIDLVGTVDLDSYRRHVVQIKCPSTDRVNCIA